MELNVRHMHEVEYVVELQESGDSSTSSGRAQGGVSMASVNNRWSAEQTLAFENTDISRPKDGWEIDPPSEVSSYHKRRTAGLWVAVATLAVALAVVAAYGYSVISKDQMKLASLPVLEKSLSEVRVRMGGLEGKLQAWQQGQKRLAARLQELNAAWKSDLNDVRSGAARLVTAAYQKQQEELNQRTAMVNAQIQEMASRQRATQVRMAQLEQQLARTREELASIRESNNQEFAALQQQQSASEHEIASINNLLSTDQVDFEIDKNQGEELVPGVSLHVTKTDTLHQRYQGWIWLAADRRTIWVRGQGIQRPVVFYPKPGSEAYELVIMRVNQKGAAGYLLVPRDTETQQAALATGKKSDANSSRFNF
jgi:predicted  nucleic acid-binding Zn-ribbon protein